MQRFSSPAPGMISCYTHTWTVSSPRTLIYVVLLVSCHQRSLYMSQTWIEFFMLAYREQVTAFHLQASRVYWILICFHSLQHEISAFVPHEKATVFKPVTYGTLLNGHLKCNSSWHHPGWKSYKTKSKPPVKILNITVPHNWILFKSWLPCRSH